MSSRLRIRFGLLAVTAAMAAGCNTLNPVSRSVDPAFGEALKYDMAVQIIDPDPIYPPGSAQPGDHGEKGAAAVERYRTDAVKDVQQVRTTSGGSGGGSGGGGSGG